MGAMKSEGQVLAEVRSQGKDTFFEWHLLERRLRLLFVIVVSPVAKPTLNWMVRKIG